MPFDVQPCMECAALTFGESVGVHNDDVNMFNLRANGATYAEEFIHPVDTRARRLNQIASLARRVSLVMISAQALLRT